MVDTQNAVIVWSHEYKLRFFVDIAVHDDVIFALGNKFTVARFHEKRELDPMNVHFEGVSFNSTSTTVITTSEGYYYGTKMGTLLRAQSDNVENVQMIEMGNVKGISTVGPLITGFHRGLRFQMIWIESENILLVGHDDGNVMILNLNPEKALHLEPNFENIVLCRINAVERNVSGPQFRNSELN